MKSCWGVHCRYPKCLRDRCKASGYQSSIVKMSSITERRRQLSATAGWKAAGSPRAEARICYPQVFKTEAVRAVTAILRARCAFEAETRQERWHPPTPRLQLPAGSSRSWLLWRTWTVELFLMGDCNDAFIYARVARASHC